MDATMFDDEEMDGFEKVHRSRRRGRKHDGRKGDEYMKSCKGKVRYATRGEAEMEQARAMERTGTDMTRYLCGFCGNYHIGHTYVRKIPGFVPPRRSRE